MFDSIYSILKIDLIKCIKVTIEKPHVSWLSHADLIPFMKTQIEYLLGNYR